MEATLKDFMERLELDFGSDSFHLEKPTPEGILHILFNMLNEELINYNSLTTAEQFTKIFEKINILFTTFDINIAEYVISNYNAILLSIAALKESEPNLNKDSLNRELTVTSFKLQEMKEKCLDQVSNKEEFLEYLIYTQRDIQYLELFLEKYPSLVNSSIDKEPSFKKLITEYIKELKSEDQESSAYYSSVISLFLSKEQLSLSLTNHKKILQELHACIEYFSHDKKTSKKHKEKLRSLHNLSDSIMNLESEPTTVRRLATKYDLSIYFTESLRNIASIVEAPSAGEQERYYINDYILTIDSKDACEIDDALSCQKLPNGNYLLGVHIASVLSYFPYESEIVKEAIRRTQTIYLPHTGKSELEIDGIIPIFPTTFSARTGSLLENVPRYARSFYFEIDSAGNIVNEKFIKSIIKSNKKATYDEVNDILEHGHPDSKYQELIFNLRDVTDILGKRHHPSASYEKSKEATGDFSKLRVKRIGAEKIVYHAMILTGNRVAEYFANSSEGFPCLYRVHEFEKDNKEELQRILKHLSGISKTDNIQELSKKMINICPQAYYGTSGSHAGLGLKHYCHCTSGLRRGADIIVEHALDVCYGKHPSDQELEQLENEIKKGAIEINSKVTPITLFVEDYHKVYRKNH